MYTFFQKELQYSLNILLLQLKYSIYPQSEMFHLIIRL